MMDPDAGWGETAGPVRARGGKALRCHHLSHPAENGKELRSNHLPFTVAASGKIGGPMLEALNDTMVGRTRVMKRTTTLVPTPSVPTVPEVTD